MTSPYSTSMNTREKIYKYFSEKTNQDKKNASVVGKINAQRLLPGHGTSLKKNTSWKFCFFLSSSCGLIHHIIKAYLCSRSVTGTWNQLKWAMPIDTGKIYIL